MTFTMPPTTIEVVGDTPGRTAPAVRLGISTVFYPFRTLMTSARARCSPAGGPHTIACNVESATYTYIEPEMQNKQLIQPKFGGLECANQKLGQFTGYWDATENESCA